MFDWMRRQPDEVKSQQAALEYYGRYFSPENIDKITQEGFKDFLLLKNNRHWSGIHRQSSIYSDMNRLQQCLRILLDESLEIENRLERIIPKNGPAFIKGLGKAVITPLLMCVYPDKYAVYNRISEEGLERLGRKTFKASEPFARRYLALNRACHEISKEIQQPLCLVDSMFSLMVHGTGSPLIVPQGSGSDTPEEPRTVGGEEVALSFPMEKFLQEFLVENWTKTALGKELDLYIEDEDVATEYQTDVGRIDILAQDKSTKDWVVIELKKGRDSDKVVGQVLRYMGWVKKHKAGSNENVRGIIITNESDDRIKYAMLVTQGISFYTYRVSFELVPEQPL
ncbi:MAG: DUF1016 family protein [Acidobacteria bacterium]|nr:DUF1016 family protein [Acidobacteriota bacterium]